MTILLARVDALCVELDNRLKDRAGKDTIGLGMTSIRELALALYVNVAYPAGSMDQSLLRAIA